MISRLRRFIRLVLFIFTAILTGTARNSWASDLNDQINSWQGRWKGQCQLESDQGVQSIGMQLEIENIDAQTLRWEITYQGQATRPYVLRSQNGPRFLLDEQNGIVLPQRLFIKQNTFRSLFSVAGSFISVEEKLVEERGRKNIFVTMTTFPLNRAQNSVGPNREKVTGYEATHLQTCKLSLAL